MDNDLENKSISRVGFGSYRTSVKSQEHYKALGQAMQLGLNLIDTSANYCDGDSELLIGKILAEHPASHPFIMTKAGYIQGKNLNVLNELKHQGLLAHEVIEISEDLKHSIHPDFLKKELEISMSRLGINQIDAYLLHNPEYFFKGKEFENIDEYYRRIKNAFEFLEEQVRLGKIKAYGISSNNFPFDPINPQCTNLNRLIKLANEVSSKHHFKYIQFPYNLLESGASQKFYNGKSLIELAKENNLVTFANRPFNAFTDDGLIRLATYEEFYQELEEKDLSDILEVCLRLIKEKWEMFNTGKKIDEIPLIIQFKEVWRDLPSPDAVDQVYLGHLFPFIAQLWGGQLDAHASKPFYVLYETSLALTRNKMTLKAEQLKKEFIEKGVLANTPNRSLTQILCQKYLDDGIDHVLVGMKKIEYVNQLKDFF